MKTMYRPGYHHNEFVATARTSFTVAFTSCAQVHELPQSHCGDNLRRAHWFQDYIYIYIDEASVKDSEIFIMNK